MTFVTPYLCPRSTYLLCVTLLAVLTASLAGCAAQRPIDARAAAPASPYELNATWCTDTGAKLHLADLRGKPRVMAMFFANCQGVCLLTVDQMKGVEASLPSDIRAKVGFVLVTLDPGRDTADKLAAYRRENNLPAETWTILRGDDQATAALANDLGITFARQSSRGFVHSSGIIVLDADGHVVQQQLNTHPDLAGMVQALAVAAVK